MSVGEATIVRGAYDGRHSCYMSTAWNPLAEIARPLTTAGQQAFWANAHV